MKILKNNSLKARIMKSKRHIGYRKTCVRIIASSNSQKINRYVTPL